MSPIIQDMNRFDEAARMVLYHAKEEAIAFGHTRIMPEHVLLGALQQNHPSSQVLVEQGLSLKKARASFEALVGRREGSGLEPDFNEASRLCLEAATAEARRLQAEQVSPGHLLLGVLRQAETNARQSGAGSAIHQILGELEGGLRGVMRRVLESLRSPQAHVTTSANTAPNTVLPMTLTLQLEPAVHQKILEHALGYGVSPEATCQTILSDWAKR